MCLKHTHKILKKQWECLIVALKFCTQRQTDRHIDTELEKGGRRETYSERERERFGESDTQRQKDLRLIQVIVWYYIKTKSSPVIVTEKSPMLQ